MKSLSAYSYLSSPLLWLAAFVCALFPLNEFQLELMGAAIVLLWFWSFDRVTKAWKDGIAPPALRWLPGLMAAFWGVLLLRALSAEVTWVAILSFFFLGALPLTFLTLARNPFTEKEWGVVRLGMGLIMAVLALWAIVQYTVFSEYFYGRARHPLADPNSLAALFNLALIFTLGEAARLQGRGRWLSFLLILLLFAGVLATGSRSGFAFMLGGVALLGLVNYQSLWQARRAWGLFLLGAGLVAAAMTLSVSKEGTTAYRMAVTIGAEDGNVQSDRLVTMKGAWHIVKDHWLLGTGTGTFYLYYPEYRDPAQKDLVTHAHNDPLQLWSEAGIAAPLLFYAMVIGAIFLTLRRTRSEVVSQENRAAIIPPFIALGVLIAHSHMNLNLYNLSILFAAGMMLAYWFARIEPPRSDCKPDTGRRKPALLAVILFVPLFAYVCMLASEHYTARARDAAFHWDLESYGHDLMMADKLGARQNPEVYMLAVNLPLVMLEQRMETLSAEDIQKEAGQIDNNLNQALTRNPRSSSAWYYKGQLGELVPADALPTDMPSPEEAYQRALKIDPIHVGARMALMEWAMDHDDLAMAGQLAKDGLRYKYLTPAAKDFYLKAAAVFSVTEQPAWQKTALDGFKMYQVREKIARQRQLYRPWRTPPVEPGSQSFPQAPDS